MRCADVHEAIRQGRAWDPQVLAHATTCGPCGVLLEAGGELGLALEELPLKATLDAEVVLERVAADRGIRARLSRLPSPLRGALVVAVVGLVVIGVVALKPRPDLSSYPVLRMVSVLGLMGAVLAVGLGIRLRPLYRAPLSLSLRSVAVIALLVVPLLIAGSAEAITGHAASMLKGPFWPTAASCFLFGTVAGGALYLALALLERRPRGSAWGTVTGAGLMGVVGNLALQLYCPVTAPSHLLAGHAMVGLVWATVFGIGALLRRC
ncbi:MAG TPA: hypothetical protein ENK18_26270 [Deltaproteobacteria bacterium]|nr:hypothetical protein [Deltaproteobacteria bacterium]